MAPCGPVYLLFKDIITISASARLLGLIQPVCDFWLWKSTFRESRMRRDCRWNITWVEINQPPKYQSKFRNRLHEMKLQKANTPTSTHSLSQQRIRRSIVCPSMAPSISIFHYRWWWGPSKKPGTTLLMSMDGWHQQKLLQQQSRIGKEKMWTLCSTGI